MPPKKGKKGGKKGDAVDEVAVAEEKPAEPAFEPYDSDGKSDYTNEDERPTDEAVLQRIVHKMKKQASRQFPRLERIAEPPNRTFLQLYSEYKHVFHPERAARIRRKIELTKTMTIESVLYNFKC